MDERSRAVSSHAATLDFHQKRNTNEVHAPYQRLSFQHRGVDRPDRPIEHIAPRLYCLNVSGDELTEHSHAARELDHGLAQTRLEGLERKSPRTAIDRSS